MDEESFQSKQRIPRLDVQALLHDPCAVLIFEDLLLVRSPTMTTQEHCDQLLIVGKHVTGTIELANEIAEGNDSAIGGLEMSMLLL